MKYKAIRILIIIKRRSDSICKIKILVINNERVVTPKGIVLLVSWLQTWQNKTSRRRRFARKDLAWESGIIRVSRSRVDAFHVLLFMAEKPQKKKLPQRGGKAKVWLAQPEKPTNPHSKPTGQR